MLLQTDIIPMRYGVTKTILNDYFNRQVDNTAEELHWIFFFCGSGTAAEEGTAGWGIPQTVGFRIYLS